MEKIKEKLKKLFQTGFFHIFGSGVINKIIAFMSSVILVRVLSKTEYGTFTYAWNIYSIILLLSGMGMESGVLQLASERSGDLQYAGRVYGFGTRFGLRFNLLLSAALLGIGCFAPLKIEGGRRLLLALCLMPVCHLFYSLYSVYLRSQKRNQEYASLQVIHSLLVFIGSLAFAFFLREMGLVAGHYAAYIVSCLAAVFFFRVRLISKEKYDLGDETKVLLKIAFISMLNNSLSQLLYLLDVFVLGIVDPQETILASYKVATTIPTALSFIPIALVTYLYPFFAEHKDDGKWCLNRYRQTVIGIGCLNLALSAILFAGAPLIVRIIFGAQYADAVPVFRILAVNYFVSGTFRTISGNLLVTQRKLQFNLVVAIVSSLINVIADYFFIQWWGSVGAAYATLLVVVVSSILSTSCLVLTFRKKAQEDRQKAEQA